MTLQPSTKPAPNDAAEEKKRQIQKLEALFGLPIITSVSELERAALLPSDSTLCAGYIRYSSEMQSDSFSLEAQLRDILEQARRDQIRVGVVFADQAQSAYSKKFRPGIEAMLATARQRRFKLLYVHKVDRLARRLRWCWDIVGELQSQIIDLKAVQQSFDLRTPEGKMVFSLLSTMGEFYSDNLSKETHKGKKERARQGYHNGLVPWGYTSQGNEIHCHKKAEIDPEVAPIIQAMYERYATGLYSDQEIANWLTDQGYKPRNGGIFRPYCVRDLLQNPFYKGYVRYRGTFQKGQAFPDDQLVVGVHEPIIGEELWDRCQAIRASRRRTVKTRQITRKVYLANGIIRCAVCGERLRAQSSRDGKCMYYREVSREKGRVGCPVTGCSVRAEEIDRQIGELLQRLELPADWQAELQDVMQQDEPGVRFDPEIERQRLRDDLRELREMKRRKLYDGEEHLFWREAEAIQEKLAALERVQANQVDAAASTLMTICNAWGLAMREEQRELAQMVLQEVGCDVEQQRVVWVKPRPGFDVLFRLISCLDLGADGRFDIRDR